MKTIQNSVILGICFYSILAFVFITPIEKTEAAEPNILIGPNMTIGSRGPNVVMLQQLLSEIGYLNVPASIPLGYYGSMTQNAVARYQADLSVSPTAGYYGPITKNAMHNHFASHTWLNLLNW
jgi:N-acetylmuramoyl-L-alanine amidase